MRRSTGRRGDTFVYQLLLVGVTGTAAIRCGVPARERVARVSKGVGCESGGRSVSPGFRYHGSRATVGVEGCGGRLLVPSSCPLA